MDRCKYFTTDPPTTDPPSTADPPTTDQPTTDPPTTPNIGGSPTYIKNEWRIVLHSNVPPPSPIDTAPSMEFTPTTPLVEGTYAWQV
jgi:hypothetical protein